MTVDLHRIKGVKPHFIDYDRPCRHCGYNLSGLMSDAVCPECGKKITGAKKDLPRYADNLVNAPMAWLKGLALGSLVLFLGAIGMFIAMPVGAWGYFRDMAAPGLVAAFLGAGWFVGVWMVTRPRPKMKTTVVDPHKEWAALRWSARGSQALWALAGLLAAIGAKTGSVQAGWAALTCFGVATLGMIPLCGLVSNLAHWGSDTTLAGHLRACAWSIGFSAFLLAMHIINVVTGAIFMGGFIASAIAALLLFFIAFPYFYVVFCCFQLQGMSRWAMLNHATAEAKDERLRARAARLAATGQSAKPPPNNADLDAFNLGDSDVSGLSGSAEAKPGSDPAAGRSASKIKHVAPIAKRPGGSGPGGARGG